MTATEWAERYSVGNPELDEHHKNLFRILDTLLDISDTNMNLQLFAESLEELWACAAHHFNAEEIYMTEAAYPDLQFHKWQHAEYCKKIDELALHLRGPQNLVWNMTSQLHCLLSDHILASDKRYVSYLMRAGQKTIS